MISDMSVKLDGGIFSQQDLEKYADQFCEKHWGVKYTGTIELVNRKWKSMWGCFMYNRADPSVQIIRMSKWLNAQRTPEEVLGTLLHELVHWRLYSQGLPSHDSTPEFVAEALRVGAHISTAKNAQEAARKYGESNG